MCGRTRSTLAPEQVLRTAGTSRWPNRAAYQPSYNLSPGGAAPVVRMADGGPEVFTMRWGLVPSFTRPDERPDFWRMFNARSESIAEKPSFRRLVPTRRCLVLADGFYEWKQEKAGKQPYYVHLAPPKQQAGGEAAGDKAAEAQGAGETKLAEGGRGSSGGSGGAAGSGSGGSGGNGGGGGGEVVPLVMAGLWDVWQGSGGEPLHTYTILTTDSCKRLEWLHDRMPVILRSQEAQRTWLDVEDKGSMGKLQQLMVPYSGEDLQWYPVTPKMNVASFQGPECCKEVKKPSIASFFQSKRPSAAAGGTGAAGSAAAAVAAAAAGGSPTGGSRQQGPKQEHGEEQEGSPAAKQEVAGAAEALNADQNPQPSPTGTAGTAAAVTTPSSGQKRKQPPSGSKGSGGSASKKAKERPAGQPDIARFFSKG